MIRLRQMAAAIKKVLSSPPPTATDPYYSSVSLLMHMEGVNDGSTFVDTKGHSVSVVSTVTKTGVKQVGNSSAYFSGASRLEVGTTNSPSFNFGTGDFTIEFWVHPLNPNRAILIGNYANATDGWAIQLSVNNTRDLTFSYGNTIILSTAANAIAVSSFNHIVVQRKSGIISIYINGVETATSTLNSTNMISGGILTLGANTSLGGYTFPLTGYLDEVRITKGVARYSGNFTPSTIAFPDSGVVVASSDHYFDAVTVLLHGDGAQGAIVITDVKGNTVTNLNSAILDTTTKKFGTAAIFMGNTDASKQLQLPSSTGELVSSASGDFTIEAWTYTSSTTEYQCLFSFGTCLGLYIRGGSYAQLYVGSSAGAESYFINGVSSAAGTIPLNQWNHIAVTRQAGTYYVLCNGNVIITNSTAGTVPLPTTSTVGAWRSFNSSHYGQWLGYIDDVRFTKGIARYTGTYIVPTEAFPDAISSSPVDPYYRNVALLLHMDGANGSTSFIDQTGKTVNTVGGTTLSTGQFKFGSASGNFASGTALTFPDISLAGDFTLEAWIYSTGHVSSQYSVLFSNSGSDNVQMLTIGLDRHLGFYASSMSGGVNSVAGAINFNQWTHIAAARTGTTLRTFINGVKVAEGSLPGNHVINCFGSYKSNQGMNLIGYADDIRVTTGRARYINNFTPPVRAFPEDYTTEPDPHFSSVVLLMHMDGVNGSTTIIDEKGRAITRVGNAALSTTQVKYGISSLATTNGSAITFGSITLNGDFTIEGWFFHTSLSSLGNSTIISSGLGGWNIQLPVIGTFNTSDALACYISDGSTSSLISTSANSVLQRNTWNHIAVVRNNGTITQFVNGQSCGQATDTRSITISTLGGYAGGGTYNLVGYADEVRITNGVARYTGNFTPPVKAFTNN